MYVAKGKALISCRVTSSVAVQPCLCRTWPESPNTGFLMTRLNFLIAQRVYTFIDSFFL